MRGCVLRDREGWRPLYGDVDRRTETDPSPADAVKPAGEDTAAPDDIERAQLIREWEESLQRNDDQRRRMRSVLGTPPHDLLDFLGM